MQVFGKKKNFISGSVVSGSRLGYLRRSGRKRFFQHRFSNAKGLFLKLSIIFSLILVIYLLFFSDFFRIKNIIVSGNYVLDNEEIEREIFNFSRQKFLKIFPRNLIFMKTSDLENIIKDRFGNIITDVEVTKKFPSTVRIEIQEKPRDISWCNKIKIERVIGSGKKTTNGDTPAVLEAAKCYFSDEKNIIYEKASAESNNNVVVFTDTPITIGFQVADDRLRNFIRQIAGDFGRKTELTVVSLYIPSVASREINLTTDQGWKIYLDVNRDLDSQILVLNNVLKNGIPQTDRQKLDYIDLRVESRVYYKTK